MDMMLGLGRRLVRLSRPGTGCALTCTTQESAVLQSLGVSVERTVLLAGQSASFV